MEKEESEFRKSSRSLWHTTQCKACLNEKDKNRRKDKKENDPETYQKILEKERERGKKARTTDEYKDRARIWRESHKEELKEYNKEYRKTHDTYTRERQWRETHKKQIQEYMKNYREKNKDKLSTYSKIKYRENVECRKQQSRDYYNNIWKQKRIEWQKNNPELNKFKNIYYGVRQRCYDKNCYVYKYYWWRWRKCTRNNFEEFYNDMRESFIKQWNEVWFGRAECQIDRINNDWDYSKENCRWVTAKQNNPDNHAKEREIRKFCFILLERANVI